MEGNEKGLLESTFLVRRLTLPTEGTLIDKTFYMFLHSQPIKVELETL